MRIGRVRGKLVSCLFLLFDIQIHFLYVFSMGNVSPIVTFKPLDLSSCLYQELDGLLLMPVQRQDPKGPMEATLLTKQETSRS